MGVAGRSVHTHTHDEENVAVVEELTKKAGQTPDIAQWLSYATVLV